MNLLQNSVSQVEEEQKERPLVLVIDDHPAIQEMLSWGLGFSGYRSASATNGQEALAWIEEALHNGQYPQVILLDLQMPVMNGSMFLEHLRHQWSAPIPIPPVILLTVDTRYHDALPCKHVLTKPFHLRELYTCLNVAIEQSKST
jgi:two-component system, chemotaxis family, chemotaxis protein CheY